MWLIAISKSFISNFMIIFDKQTLDTKIVLSDIVCFYKALI